MPLLWHCIARNGTGWRQTVGQIGAEGARAQTLRASAWRPGACHFRPDARSRAHGLPPLRLRPVERGFPLARDQIGRAHYEIQSLMGISNAVFCLKKKKK